MKKVIGWASKNIITVAAIAVMLFFAMMAGIVSYQNRIINEQLQETKEELESCRQLYFEKMDTVDRLYDWIESLLDVVNN